MRIVRLQPHYRAVLREVRDGRKSFRAKRAGSAGAGKATRHLHALAEHRLAGVARGRGRVLDELEGLIAGHHLRNSVEIEVRHRAERAVSVAADRAAGVRLRAQCLAGRGIEYAIADHDLRRARGPEQPCDRRRSPPDLRFASHPEEAAVAAEGNQTAMLMGVLRIRYTWRLVVGIPTAGDETDLSGSHAIAGCDSGV